MADIEQTWIVHPLVVAKYPKDDPLGMFYGYYSLLVYEVQAVYITLFLRNRDLLTFQCCFTHLLSEILNYLLKHILKQPRPDHGAPGGGLFEGRYGMPSQHCHCMAYIVATVNLLVFHYYRKYVSTITRFIVLVLSLVALSLQISGYNYFLPQADRLCRLKILSIFSFRKDLSSRPPGPTQTRPAIKKRS